MYILLYILPILNILILNRKGGEKIIPITIINSLILFIIGLIIIIENDIVILNLGTWIEIYDFQVNWIFKIDNLTRGMLFPILFISLLVQIFSYDYMYEDPHKIRFYLYLNIFSLAMLILVTGDNLFLLFLGWEFVGLASYLLVNFWYTRIVSNHASLKAFLFNRIGDWGLTLGILLFYISLGNINIIILEDLNPNLLTLLTFFLFLGGIAKSAQLGLHSWLTDAMAGPTPVSALLHAATMVTAGVYLTMRLSILIEWSDDILLILSWFGGLSALAGGIGGLYEYDIKKIIAYSTISQLGYMIISSGLSLYQLSLWHLINHALFKALLFLSAGALIHSIFDIQDIRKYGNIGHYLPLLFNSFLLGNLSIIAFPFFTGFYSKDLILELTMNTSSSFLFILIYIAALITASYSIKLFIFTFISLPNFSFNIHLNFHTHLNFPTYIPLILLSIGALIFGDLSSLFPYLNYENILLFLPTHFTDFLNTHNILLFTFIPLLLLLLQLPLSLNIISSHLFWKFMEFIPLDNLNKFYNRFIYLIFSFSNYLYRYFDRGLLEIIIGGTGLNKILHYISFRFELLSTGYFYHLFISFISILTLFLFFT